MIKFRPADRDGVDGSKFPGQSKSSVGTGVDQLGFSFADLEKQMPKLLKSSVFQTELI